MTDPDDPGGPGSRTGLPADPAPEGVIVALSDEQDVAVDGDAIERAARAAATMLSMRGELSLALVGAAEIADLKGRYYGEHAATDVLSFAMDGPAGPTIGDVVICPEVAARQARALGVPLAAEMIQLVVHGTLHLAGLDHATPADEVAMAAREREILASLPA